jgi:hypothetical protein
MVRSCVFTQYLISVAPATVAFCCQTAAPHYFYKLTNFVIGEVLFFALRVECCTPCLRMDSGLK